MRTLLILLAACQTPNPEMVEVLPALDPEWAPPDEVGPYGVGVSTAVIARDDGYDLTVEIWYPATVDPTAEIEFYDDLFHLRLAAHRDAPPDLRETLSVVAFSHGFGGVRFQSAFLTEHLASHGFVVIAPDHPRNTLFELYTAEAAEVAARRPGDVTDALDWLFEVGATTLGLEGALHPARVGVIGHSFGAITSLALGGAGFDPVAFEAHCATEGGRVCGFLEGQTIDADLAAREGRPDSRVVATVALAPGGYYAFGPDGADLADVAAPLVLAGTHDGELPYESEALPVYERLGSPARLGTFENGGHWAFSDLCGFLPLEDCAGTSAGFMDVEAVQSLTRSRVTAHLAQHLRDDPDVEPWLTGAEGFIWESR